MVTEQIAARGVRDGNVLDAMGTVRREIFVPNDVRELAYNDTPLITAELRGMPDTYPFGV